MSDRDHRVDALRKKRAKILESKNLRRLRIQYGPSLADAVAIVLGKEIVLDNFSTDIRPSVALELPQDLRFAKGLVAANVGREEADGLLACIHSEIGAVSGVLGFHEKTYMGFVKLEDVVVRDFLEISETTEESVMLCIERPCGVILVDCYPSQPDGAFSIVVQGNELESRLRSCFGSRAARA